MWVDVIMNAQTALSEYLWFQNPHIQTSFSLSASQKCSRMARQYFTQFQESIRAVINFLAVMFYLPVPSLKR